MNHVSSFILSISRTINIGPSQQDSFIYYVRNLGGGEQIKRKKGGVLMKANVRFLRSRGGSSVESLFI